MCSLKDDRRKEVSVGRRSRVGRDESIELPSDVMTAWVSCGGSTTLYHSSHCMKNIPYIEVERCSLEHLSGSLLSSSGGQRKEYQITRSREGMEAFGDWWAMGRRPHRAEVHVQYSFHFRSEIRLDENSPEPLTSVTVAAIAMFLCSAPSLTNIVTVERNDMNICVRIRWEHRVKPPWKIR